MDPFLLSSNSIHIMKYLLTARNAGAVIHSHSKAAVLATLIFTDTEFKISHLEMIKVRIF